MKNITNTTITFKLLLLSPNPFYPFFFTFDRLKLTKKIQIITNNLNSIIASKSYMCFNYLFN